jgi:hypothetical protein
MGPPEAQQRKKIRFPPLFHPAWTGEIQRLDSTPNPEEILPYRDIS